MHKLLIDFSYDNIIDYNINNEVCPSRTPHKIN